MRACLIYSGWKRTYDQCKANQTAMLVADEFTEYHRDESTANIDFFKFDIEQYNENRIPETKVRHTLNQWHNSFFSFGQASPQDGDVFVRIRYDIELTGQIRFADYPLKDNLVYIPFGQDYRAGVNDQFAFGNYQSMKKYFSVYLNHERIFNQGVPFHTESYLRKHLENEGVEIKRLEVETVIKR